MKHIKLFEEFLNEGYYGDYKQIVTKVYTKANNGGYEPRNEWYGLSRSLQSLGFDPKITLAKLLKDPKFSQLDQYHQDDILMVTGVKGGKNKAFVQDLIGSIKSFGAGVYSGRGYDDLENEIYKASEYKNYVDDVKNNTDNIIYTIIDGIDYNIRKQISKKHGYTSDIIKKLTKDEVDFIIKQTLPSINSYIKNHLTDYKINKWLQYELKTRFKAGEEPWYFSGTNWTQDEMKKPLDFVKGLISKGESIKWNNFSVDRSMLGSEHSKVVSSSFSTTYYYSVKLNINGKSFNMPKVAGGSTSFSGGYN